MEVGKSLERVVQGAVHKVRPMDLLGEIDVKRYVKEILACVIQFGRTFGFLDLIEEHVIYETGLFLEQYIQQHIFERTDSCHLPAFAMPPPLLV